MPRVLIFFETSNYGGICWERLTEFYLRTTSKDRYPLDAFTPRKSHTKIDERDINDFNRLKLAPVTKRNPNVALAQSERGQISIFFSASLVVIVSIVAFVINIGLFVKAKINLQNATDAAAFSGAAVQARQLTKIAYLNWEMRNIYKEWLYKYYVVGNLNIDDVENPKTSGVMDFRLKPDQNHLTNVVTNDQFNIPAVCIHISGGQTNICKRYAIPGFPEFGNTGLPGASEASRAFMDTLIGTKVADCVDRTRLNMSVGIMWNYNVLGNSFDESIAGQGPAILSDRQGAWPKAVEVAIRIRNLEFVMNRKAETSGICINGTTNAGLTRCKKSITEISQERMLGNERIVKAFYSGYRNLGNEADDEMKQSFTLSEISPKPYFNQNLNNNSNLLVKTPYEKQWVDLKLMMVNYATFYAAMIPRADSATSGACDISKVAIPVPGYPMGFYKNPDVLTYYAVKGEAEFLGMFNPFKTGPVKLQAYAAAKPMGGRIGPMLFTQKENQDFLTSRTDNAKFRSVPYMASYDFRGVTIRNQTYTGEEFLPGLPLPTNSNKPPGQFWLDNPGKPIGGLVADASGVQFGLPNLVYDYQTPFQPTGYSPASDAIHTIAAANPSTDKEVGLFSRFQFNKFRGTALSGQVTPNVLDEEVARVRAPTLYESSNYLIPSPNDFNIANGLDSFGLIGGDGEALSNGIKRYRGKIFAPLFRDGANDQADLLYLTKNEVEMAIFNFMRAQVTGIRKYKMAMNRAAMEIDRQKTLTAGSAINSAAGYERAAKAVSDIDFTNPDVDQMPASCKSLSGQFLYFYYGGPVSANEAPSDSTNCPKPLGSLFQEYFAKNTKDAGYDPTYYEFQLSWPEGSAATNITTMSAYTPGPLTGATIDGKHVNPINGNVDNMRRNFYSTKLIRLDSLQPGSGDKWDSTFPIHSEGSANSASGDTAQTAFKNPLDFNSVDADISSIKY